MSKVEDFLSKEEEQEIIEAIRTAELNTSGEIRVHIEKTSQTDAFNRALEVFHYLKMDNTKDQNGVLIYVAVKDKTFVIYGDKGINEVVPNNFWESTKDIIQSHFKTGNFKQGLVEGILEAGKELEKHFNVVKDTKKGFRTFWVEINNLFYSISVYRDGLNLSPNIQKSPKTNYTNKYKELPESHRSSTVSKEGITYLIAELKRLA